MQSKRKICVVTGTRAEFGLLTPLMNKIVADESLLLQVIVTGTHLSPEYGLTIEDVESKFNIDKKIEILLSSDSSVGVCKSMGLAKISFAEAYDELLPDIVVVLGDRYEILAATSSAMIMGIPIAHISGGEITEGAIDDSIRHAITKMSHLHFVATEEYRRRVIQLGENEQFVFNFGEAGLDNILELELLDKPSFESSINHSLDKKSLLITYHPVTLSKLEEIEQDCKNILQALDSLYDTTLIFTKANSDVGGRLINQLLENYVSNNLDKAILFDSLGQLRYLSALQYIDALVGNSSSGIVEAASFKLPVVNIGDRQKGRIAAANVIHADASVIGIQAAISKIYEQSFQDGLRDLVNPYGQGSSSDRTKDILKTIDLTGITKKRFFDL